MMLEARLSRRMCMLEGVSHVCMFAAWEHASIPFLMLIIPYGVLLDQNKCGQDQGGMTPNNNLSNHHLL